MTTLGGTHTDTSETCGQPVGSQDWSYVNGHWQTTWLNGESICAAPDNDINTPPLPAPPNVVNGALVIGRYCGSRPRESWTKGPRDNTWVFHGIRMQFGYMCLDNTGGLVQSGNLVQVWKCSDYYNPNQVSGQ